MDFALDFLQAAGPAIAGVLTVPVVQGIKALSGRIASSPAIVKQMIGVLVAFGITKLGATLDVALPGDLALFSGEDVEAAIAAAIAFGVHAGKKAKEASPRGLE